MQARLTEYESSACLVLILWNQRSLKSQFDNLVGILKQISSSVRGPCDGIDPRKNAPEIRVVVQLKVPTMMNYVRENTTLARWIYSCLLWLSEERKNTRAQTAIDHLILCGDLRFLSTRPFMDPSSFMPCIGNFEGIHC